MDHRQGQRALMEIATTLGRLEEGINALRREREEDRGYLVETSRRVAKLELDGARSFGWITGAAAVVSAAVAIIVPFIKNILGNLGQ